MKKIILVGIMFMMFMGVVSAASFNGDYKGNPIVTLYSDSTEVKPDDVPALIYNGRTVVPISILKKIGLKVTWNQEDYSVDVELPTPDPLPTPIPKLTLSQVSKDMKKYGVDMINYMTDGEGVDTITYYTNFTSTEGLKKVTEYNAILESSMNSDATILEVYYTDKFIITIPNKAIRDFKNGSITEKQFIDAQKYNMPISMDTPSTQYVPTNEVNTNQPITTATPTPKPNNIDQCKNLRDSYNLAKSKLDRTNSPFSGQASYEEKLFESTWAQTFAAAGC